MVYDTLYARRVIYHSNHIYHIIAPTLHERRIPCEYVKRHCLRPENAYTMIYIVWV